MYLNKAMIVGNLTRDPEMKALPSGSSVTSFSLATNRVYNDKDGNRQESVDYHNIVVFGKQAESVAKYLTKGSQALVEGRLQTRSWETDGKKNYRTEIVADRVQFGSKPKDSAPAPAAKPATETGNEMPEYPEEEINPEDIPF
jgi:single-strand DNA-binding protein